MINVIKIQQGKGEKGYQRRCYFIAVGWGDLSEEVPFEQRLKIGESKTGRYLGEVCSKRRQHKMQKCLACFRVSKEASVGKADSTEWGWLRRRDQRV